MAFDRGLKRAMHGFRIYGDIRYLEAVFAIRDFPKISKGVKIKIYNSEGLKLQEIGDDIQNNIIDKIKFELIETGCGAFSFSLLARPSVDIAFTNRVDIHLFGDKNPWFSGEIFKIPVAGSTTRPFKYSGFGFAHQLETTKIDQAYNSTTFPTSSDRDIAAIVNHLMTQFIEDNSSIVYNKAKIESPEFVITDIDFDKISAMQTLNKLKDISQNFFFGVDERRDLFFKQIDTEVDQDKIRVVGKNVKSFALKEPDSSKVKNDIDIVAGLITSSSNFIANVQNADSIATYGRRWTKLSIPESLDITDATRWGNFKLSDLKDPKQSAKVKDVEIIDQIRIAVEGKARIIDIDGTQHDMFMKKVVYKISKRGIVMDWILGELDIPLEESILNIIRNLKNQEALQASNVAQLA